MRGPTLPSTPMKTYSPISINLRDKLEVLSLEILFHSPLTPTLCLDFPFSFSFFKFGYMAHIAPCVHLLFGSVFTSKQFISF